MTCRPRRPRRRACTWRPRRKEARAGEGGEAGIDVAAAANDPVEYGVALQVIAAHYYAGLAAYEAKEFEAGAQMFAHGLSEVYVEMEDILRQRGVTTLGKKLEAAVEGASAKLPPPQIRRRVRAVLDALAAAEKASPMSAGPVQVTRAQVVANLLNRAATQYSVSLNDKNSSRISMGSGSRSRRAPKPRKSCLGCAAGTNKRPRQSARRWRSPSRPIRAFVVPARNCQPAGSWPRRLPRCWRSRTGSDRQRVT